VLLIEAIMPRQVTIGTCFQQSITEKRPMTHKSFPRSFRTSSSKAKSNKSTAFGAGGLLGQGKGARLPVPSSMGAGAAFGRAAPQRVAGAAPQHRGAGALECGCDAALVLRTNRHACSAGVCDSQTPVPLPTTQGGAVGAGDSVTVTAQVTTAGFAPAYATVADTAAPDWNITAITGPGGQNLLLGGAAMLGEFFSSKNERGGQVAACCIPAALSITVTAENISDDTASNFQMVFWGTCGPCT
jgi:hypothetical protein